MSLFKKQLSPSSWAISNGRKLVSLDRASVEKILTASACAVRALIDVGEAGEKEGFKLAYKLVNCYLHLELKKAKIPISTLAQHYDGGRRIGVVCIKEVLNFTQEKQTISKPMEQVREIDGVKIRLLDGSEHFQDSYLENDIPLFTPLGVEVISVYEFQTTGCTVARNDIEKLRANIDEFLFSTAPQIKALLADEVFRKFFIRRDKK